MAFVRRVRRLTRALVDDVWQCLIAVGTVQFAGGARTRALANAPAPGHPERLRPDLPLTALERALLEDLGPVG